MRTLIGLFLLAMLVFTQTDLHAQLAENYPNDIGIENDPNVHYVEKFDDGLSNIISRYTDVLNAGGMFLDPDVPPGSLDPFSIRMTSAPGVSNGGHLYRSFNPGFNNTIHVRYYVKYPASSQNFFHHEGVWFGGYNPVSLWPMPGAGTCGLGDKRLGIAFEPVWHNTDPPGFDTYLYWGDMKSWNDGSSCFGNVMVTQGATEYNEPLDVGDYPAVELDEWMCIEMMIKLNDPVTAYNGELAIWVNGEQVGHWGPGFPNGHWLKDKWYNNPADPPFEGFRWRTHPNLNINWLWILFFHSNPVAPASYIKYDHLVVANQYIGPIQISSANEAFTQPQTQLLIYPNPASSASGLTLRLDGVAFPDGEKMVALFDLAGKQVYAQSLRFQNGVSQLNWPQGLPGYYLARVSDAQNTFESKLVIH